MKELRDILKAYDEAIRQNKRVALATVVNVEGSSYRRPGARMLVTEDGHITGAISGGCLEGDALKKARLAIMQQQNKLVTYDSTDEDDIKFGVQLGCNGIISILFEPIQPQSDHNPMRLVKKVCASRKNTILVTGFAHNNNACHAGTCAYLSEDELILMIEDHIILDAEIISSGSIQKSVVLAHADHSVLYQRIVPPLQLVIAGAGNDAKPLTEMADILGWQTTVVDGRATHATRERFPKADDVKVCGPGDVIDCVDIDANTAFALLTHNYNYDIALLEGLIKTKCNYIGILGPKKKTQRMLDELNEKGIILTDAQYDKIHGPVGLDIGAEAAEEIAVSIISEITAMATGRSGQPLKFREGSIYERA